MQFRNNKGQRDLSPDDSYEEELSKWGLNSNYSIDQKSEKEFWEKQGTDERLLMKPKREATVTEVSYEDQYTFWNFLNDIQYGQFNPETLVKKNTWVITRDGSWLVQKSLGGYFGIKKNDFGIPTLPASNSLPEKFFNLTHGKIPNQILLQIVSFFREIMKRHNDAEAFIQVYWDKEENKYICHTPKQRISKGSVEYNAEENLDILNKKRYIFVYECHSHNSMGAFWSGTDNADEKELRVYGVFGRLDTDDYQNCHRFFVGEEEAALDISDVFDIPEVIDENKFLVTHKNKQYLVKRDDLILDAKPKYIYQTANGEKLYVPVENVIVYKEPSAKVDFPETWFTNINVPLPPRTYTTNRNSGAVGPHGIGRVGRNWDGGSGHQIDLPLRKHESYDFSQVNNEQEDEEVGADYELMVHDASILADEVTYFTSDFEEIDPTFAFLERIEQNLSLKALEKAIQHYYYRSRQVIEEGPTDGRY